VSLKEIDAVIGIPESSWYEYNIVLLADILVLMGNLNWEQLKVIFESKPLYWKVRFAEGLDELGDDRSLDLLSFILNSSEREVSIIAACALEDAEYPLGKEFTNTLQNLLSQMNESTETRYSDVEKLLIRVTK